LYFMQFGVFIMVTFVALFIGLIAFGFAHRLNTTGQISDVSSKPNIASSQTTPSAQQEGSQSILQARIPELEPTLTPWDGVGRVTILLLGLDFRDWEAGNDYSRSDTMILLTLDPLTKSAGILTVPRDLWVSIPGFKHGKINTAYYLGDAYKLPGGGPGLAIKTVEQFLGVPINYYAQIDFGAFVKFIDEIGGVKVDVPENITVDLLGSGSATKKTLQPGVQVLPGEWALAYARARYTEGGDFDRSKRQLQVIMGIRDRIISLDMLPVLISKANVLYQQLSSGIHTNLPLDDATKLAILAAQVPMENIKQGIIGSQQIIFGTSPDNLSILIPLIDKIHLLRDEIFSVSGALGPLTSGNYQERMILENARVSLLNASSQPGLEQRTAEYLKSLGVNVVETGQASQTSSLTSIQDNYGKPFTVKYLSDLMGIQPQRIKAENSPQSQTDVQIILGNDWSNNDQMK
jgi:polyisoprenyl-teichoic acid--peptidoglycan teichoic acid transferase